AAGPDIALMVDTNCAWTLDEAIAMARKLKEYNLAWLEEPVYPVDDYDAMARIRGETGVTVAAGENIGNAGEARHAIELGALDIFQPSVTKIGGIAAMREAITIARQHGVRVMPHSPYFGPGLIATLHVIAACLPDSMCERFYCELEATPLGAAIDARDGHIRSRSDQGLGSMSMKPSSNAIALFHNEVLPRPSKEQKSHIELQGTDADVLIEDQTVQ